MLKTTLVPEHAVWLVGEAPVTAGWDRAANAVRIRVKQHSSIFFIDTGLGSGLWKL